MSDPLTVGRFLEMAQELAAKVPANWTLEKNALGNLRVHSANGAYEGYVDLGMVPAVRLFNEEDDNLEPTEARVHKGSCVNCNKPNGVALPAGWVTCCFAPRGCRC